MLTRSSPMGRNRTDFESTLSMVFKISVSISGKNLCPPGVHQRFGKVRIVDREILFDIATNSLSPIPRME